MADVKVGHISREPGYFYSISGDGTVMRTPLKGHKGTKAKVGQVQRIASAFCWISGSGDVICRKR